MSQLGAPYTPPPPYAPPAMPPPSPPSSAEIPGWMVLLAAFLAFALAGLLAFVIVEGREDGSSAAPAPRVVHHFPQHWNHRIAPLARIVARQRGLHFEHPVAVRFLSASAFQKSLDAEGRTTSREDRRQAAQAAGMMRALGLVSGQVNLIHAVHDANGAEVLAYYSFHDKRINVRGRDLTPSVKVTLVHELTHVLQDQHFRIGPRLRTLQQAKGPSTTAYDVLDAIVEGDADRMASEYRSSLPASQRRAVAATDGLERRHARRGPVVRHRQPRGAVRARARTDRGRRVRQRRQRRRRPAAATPADSRRRPARPPARPRGRDRRRPGPRPRAEAGRQEAVAR